jgi:sulfite reductase (NADPH) hemoprotein beta-component
MYLYDPIDQRLVDERVAQFADQTRRFLDGQLSEDDFRVLRLQNGPYIQKHAPMLRVAIPYGILAARQLRTLAHIARKWDRGYGHFSTRQNIQFNWPRLEDVPAILAELATVQMHAIQTSGNCIRNTTVDHFAGVAPDELVNPLGWCELIRQWSALNPEFAFLPRKFKIAVSGAREDRAAVGWHDIGLELHRDAAGAVGWRVRVGGGMGRTPLVGRVIADFVPWQQILVFIEAIVRVYNLLGRRDNLHKARIKILVKAEGERFAEAVRREFEAILPTSPHRIPQAEFDRVAASFVDPVLSLDDAPAAAAGGVLPPAYRRWVERNVHAHRLPGYRAVTLSLKRARQPPGDVTAAQMDGAAELAERFSAGELRVTHDQNLLLPWVRERELHALWAAAREGGFATPNIGLLTDMICCPGGDLCALANARSIPIAAAIQERFDDLDELHDIGDVDLHISGCMNSCGHHHSGHIGILGVDKDGSEWYQVTIAGADGSTLSGAAAPGKVIGPSFAADEVPDVVEALLEVYRAERRSGERFVDVARRLGPAAFRDAADAARRTTSAAAA